MNSGSPVVGAGVVANDVSCFVGTNTTATELTVIERIFKLNVVAPLGIATEIRKQAFEEI